MYALQTMDMTLAFRQVLHCQQPAACSQCVVYALQTMDMTLALSQVSHCQQAFACSQYVVCAVQSMDMTLGQVHDLVGCSPSPATQPASSHSIQEITFPASQDKSASSKSVLARKQHHIVF